MTIFPRASTNQLAFGDTIFFDIEFSELDNVEFIRLPILYDPLLLAYLPNLCIETFVLSGFTCNNNVIPTQQGQIRIFWSHPNNQSSDIFDNDPIVTLAFEVVGVGANLTPITIPNSIDGFETFIANS